jgi:hypothetical protein
MTLDEAKEILSTCRRDELIDDVFGDCEICWWQDKELKAAGYFAFSEELNSVSFTNCTRFVGADASVLASCGKLRRIQHKGY